MNVLWDNESRHEDITSGQVTNEDVRDVPHLFVPDDRQDHADVRQKRGDQRYTDDDNKKHFPFCQRSHGLSPNKVSLSSVEQPRIIFFQLCNVKILVVRLRHPGPFRLLRDTLLDLLIAWLLSSGNSIAIGGKH